MMVMTAKVDIRKILLVLAAIAGVIIALVLLFGGANADAPTAAASATASVNSNDARVQFLKDFGWDVSASPTESSQVRIPEETTEVFDRYNALQKSQGYDLTPYAGKTVMRYVYKVNNFPEATDPVYATVLVYKSQVIGGDITNTAAGGVIQGFQKAADKTTPQPIPSTIEPTQVASAQ